MNSPFNLGLYILSSSYCVDKLKIFHSHHETVSTMAIFKVNPTNIFSTITSSFLFIPRLTQPFFFLSCFSIPIDDNFLFSIIFWKIIFFWCIGEFTKGYFVFCCCCDELVSPVPGCRERSSHWNWWTSKDLQDEIVGHQWGACQIQVLVCHNLNIVFLFKPKQMLCFVSYMLASFCTELFGWGENVGSVD